MIIPIKVIVFLIVSAGVVWLQIFLSKNQNKWLGLVLPVITFAFSMIYVLNISDTGSLWDTAVLIIEVLLISNIPTIILLAIYFASRDKIKKKIQIEKMNIKDLK